jgi:XrtN system VIT domain protein
MFHNENPAKDKLYLSGLVFLILSLLVFCIPMLGTTRITDTFGFFGVNFIFTAAYFFMLLASGRLRKGRNGLPILFIFLVLFLISAYALNREMTVFQDTVNWFTVVLVLSCTNYLLFAWHGYLPPSLQLLSYFIAGISFASFFYLSCYLLPLYAIGGIAFFALGISLHTFVPFLFCIYTIVQVRKTAVLNTSVWISFSTGIGLAIICVAVFAFQWASQVSSINKAYRTSGVDEQNNLPSWISVAKHNDNGWITQRILKSEWVYSVPDINRPGGDFFWGMPGMRGFNETKKHDPLVMVAALFGGKLSMTDEDRIRILESMFDARHQAERRLWSGTDLITEKVNTDIQVWPALHLAYTEQKITVSNIGQRRWRGQQEALYTFQLPEGSVITSLSLWIEGQESKALLTTKEKADSAYTTIVGIENRDPSVVHWREGNTVTVRVFPVETGKSRLFKIGITSPLKRVEDKLVYENIYFRGPDFAHAEEQITLNIDKANNQVIVPAAFAVNDKKGYRKSGKYQPRWKMEINDVPISPNSFSFNGSSYSIQPYTPKRLPANFSTIFLDINKSWTEEDFDQLWKLISKKQVYVYDGQLQVLTEENKGNIFNKLSGMQFSLFPFYLVKDPSSSLVITKNSGESPNLGDMQESNFYKQLTDGLATREKIRLFDLGYEPSPYLKSLREYRAFQYENGGILMLKQIIDNSYFMNDVENESSIIIHDADLVIRKSEGVAANTAPDHAMRLFTYNNIMRMYGTDVIMKKLNNHLLAKEAAEAYVVTPVSSLVVLESQKDYDRFDIRDETNSLKNASLGSKGSVPEPHEWALIIVVLLALIGLKFQPAWKRLW